MYPIENTHLKLHTKRHASLFLLSEFALFLNGLPQVTAGQIKLVKA